MYRIVYLVLLGLSLTGIHAQVRPQRLADSVTVNQLGDISLLKSGAFGTTSDEEVTQARAGHLLQILEQHFARAQDSDLKAAIANSLVSLGDNDDAYWNFLVERARPAIESDAPDPGRCSGQNCQLSRPADYLAWAKAHNVAPGSSQEAAILAYPARIRQLGSGPGAVFLLRQALLSPNFEVVGAAASGLAAADDKDSIPQLISAGEKVPHDVAIEIATALELFDDPRAKAFASSHLPKPPNPLEALRQGQLRAIEKVIESKNRAAIPILEEQFANGPFAIPPDKAHIASALIRLGEKDEIYWGYLVQQARNAVHSGMPSPVGYDAQGNTIAGPSPEFTAWAQARNLAPETAAGEAMFNAGYILFLAQTEDPRGIPLIRQALLSPDYMMEVMAAKGLAGMGDKDSIPLIIQACRRAPYEVADAISTGALLYFDDPQAQAAVDEYVPKGIASDLRADIAKRRQTRPW